MPSNPKPQEPQPREPRRPTKLNPKDFEITEGQAIEADTIRKTAGKPSVKNQVAKPKIGAVDKVKKPTFGIVRGVYN